MSTVWKVSSQVSLHRLILQVASLKGSLPPHMLTISSGQCYPAERWRADLPRWSRMRGYFLLLKPHLIWLGDVLMVTATMECGGKDADMDWACAPGQRVKYTVVSGRLKKCTALVSSPGLLVAVLWKMG